MVSVGRAGIAASLLFLSTCAPLGGYPNDPEDTSATLSALKPYFDGTEAAQYMAIKNDDTARKQKRDEIVLARMRAYDIEFSDFERSLFEEANSVSIGADLIVLTLGGLTATTGGASTKAALGAATAGITGAQAAINKDLYYQRTIPALLAQMEANRAKAKVAILQGLNRPDSQYPLAQAYIDLDALKQAGSIPGAIADITQQAGTAKQAAQSQIEFMRGPAYIAQLADIQSIQTSVDKLTPQQLLDLAKTMQQYLSSRPEQIQSLVKALDPNAVRLSGDAVVAKKVLNAWINEDDMSAANKKQWTDAIAKVTGK